MPRVKQVNNRNKSLANEDWKCIGKRAAYATGIGAAASYLLFGETGTLELAGMAVPASVGVGVACAGGSAMGDLLSDMVIDKYSTQSAGVKTAEETAVKLGISAVGTVATLQLAYGVSPSLNGALVGAGSKAGADYIEENVDPLGMLF